MKILKSALVMATLALAPSISHSFSDSSLSQAQKLRAMQMTSYFENGTFKFSYDYIENINDGRGFTAGRIGFTSATGDLFALVKMYCEKPKALAELCSFETTLRRLAKEQSGDTSELGLKFVRAWKKANKHRRLQRLQDHATDIWYFNPAMKIAREVGIQTALGKAIFYDTIIQHGEEGDDSLRDIINRTEAKIGNCVEGSEGVWLKKFLAERREDLLNPKNSASQQAWSESVDRVDFFRKLIKEKNFDLKGPIYMDAENQTKESVVL